MLVFESEICEVFAYMFKNKEKTMSDSALEIKNAVITRLAKLDSDQLLETVERLQATVLSQAVQLSELQAENVEQVLKIQSLEISLEEAMSQLSEVHDTHVSFKKIADFVINSINDGSLPIPKNIDKNLPLSIRCDPEKISFDFDGFRVRVEFVSGGCSQHNVVFRLPISPDDRFKEVYYPDFHFGYTKPTPAKRVNKPKEKPAEKKAD